MLKSQLKFGVIGPSSEDARDFTEHNILEVEPKFKLPFFKQSREVNNDKFAPVGKIQSMNDCIAHGISHSMSFLGNKEGKSIEISRLDLYYLLSFLMRLKDENKTLEEAIQVDDVGGYIRRGLQALSHGILPECFIKYAPEDYKTYTRIFRENPWLIRFAEYAKAIKRIRLDYPGISDDALINSIKKWCEAGIPIVFGLELSSNYYNSFKTGLIEIPNYKTETELGGHCMYIPAGYNDNKELIRIGNSHPDWGDSKRLGYMRYDTIKFRRYQRRIIYDVWAIVGVEGVSDTEFGVKAK